MSNSVPMSFLGLAGIQSEYRNRDIFTNPCDLGSAHSQEPLFLGSIDIGTQSKEYAEVPKRTLLQALRTGGDRIHLGFSAKDEHSDQLEEQVLNKSADC